jgi:hypothetical protein
MVADMDGGDGARWRGGGSVGWSGGGKEVRQQLCGAVVLENTTWSSMDVEQRGRHDGGKR